MPSAPRTPLAPARHRRPFLAGSVLVCSLLAAAPPAAAEDLVDGVALSAGIFNVLDQETSAEAGFELRLRPFAEGTGDRPWVLRPAIGAMATTESALYGYAGFRLEWPLAERWLLVPQTAAGYYERGSEKNLGGSVQFRSGIELAYLIDPGHSVGMVFYHLSNAGLERPNPGSESLVVYWAWR